jgi:hypothetical protein
MATAQVIRLTQFENLVVQADSNHLALCRAEIILSTIPAKRRTERDVITGKMIRGARAMLGWSAQTLSVQAHVGVATVLRIERSRDSSSGRCETLKRLEDTLLGAGIRFIEDEGGEGVCLHGEASLPH